MSLKTIALAFEQFAVDVLNEIKEEGLELAVEIASDVKDSFEDLVERFGGVSTKFVAALVNDDTLAGSSKADLAARRLVEEASLKGVTISGVHASALIQSAYTAVMDQLKAAK